MLTDLEIPWEIEKIEETPVGEWKSKPRLAPRVFGADHQ